MAKFDSKKNEFSCHIGQKIEKMGLLRSQKLCKLDFYPKKLYKVKNKKLVRIRKRKGTNLEKIHFCSLNPQKITFSCNMGQKIEKWTRYTAKNFVNLISIQKTFKNWKRKN